MAGDREAADGGLTGRADFRPRDPARGLTFAERLRALDELVALLAGPPPPRRKIIIRDARL